MFCCERAPYDADSCNVLRVKTCALGRTLAACARFRRHLRRLRTPGERQATFRGIETGLGKEPVRFGGPVFCCSVSTSTHLCIVTQGSSFESLMWRDPGAAIVAVVKRSACVRVPGGKRYAEFKNNKKCVPFVRRRFECRLYDGSFRGRVRYSRAIDRLPRVCVRRLCGRRQSRLDVLESGSNSTVSGSQLGIVLHVDPAVCQC